ncbi:hypothetical protein CLOM_g6709 [Closterium sp. NIES-68]|nr:hypothetical protein CLOM_g6709 [Closterium sp. NIES-68]
MLLRFRFVRLGSLPIQPHAALSRLLPLRYAPHYSPRALPRTPPRAYPPDVRPRHLTVVAGRRNHGGGTMKQRPKDWRTQSTPFHARDRSHRRNDRVVPLGPRGGSGDGSADGGDVSAEGAERRQRTTGDLGADWRLGPGEAVGRVMSAQANFVRVIVTRCGVEHEIEGSEERREESDQGANGHPLQGGPGERPRGTVEQRAQEQRRQGDRAEGGGGKEGRERREERGEEREGVELLCVVRALLKKLKRRVLVGDVVRLGGIDWAARQAVVQDVALPRASEILDPPVANADHLLLLFSLAQPPPEPMNVSRFLVAAEATGVAVSLVFNKADLVEEEAVREWQQRAAEWGYSMHTCSVERRIGVRQLAGPGGLLAGRTTVIAGPSGVGKSSLINAVLGEAYNGEAYKEEAFEGDGLKEGGFGERRRVAEGECEGRGGGEEEEEREGEGTVEELECGSGWREGESEMEGRSEKGRGGEARFEELRVGEVSRRSGRGRHTTRHVALVTIPDVIIEGGAHVTTPELIAEGDGREPVEGCRVQEEVANCSNGSRSHNGSLSSSSRTNTSSSSSSSSSSSTTTTSSGGGSSSCSGGLLADTPGFSQPSLGNVSSSDLPMLFPEIRTRLASSPTSCAFTDCRHISEPGCAVGSGWERYRHYVMLMEEIRARETAEIRAMGTKREGDVRLKSGGYGVVIAEPRLEPKKHRRESRKKGKQLLLQQLAAEEEEDDDDEEGGVGFVRGPEGSVRRR